MNHRWMRRRREAGVLIGMLLALGACSGGGGSNVKPASSPPPSSGKVPQPPLDAQLSLTHTYAAHDAGLTGKGVTIGVVDSGIMSTNPAVSGRVVKELIYVDPAHNNTSIQDVIGHGTWVSEIAAGTSFAQFPGGIAPGADLVSARIISDNAPSDNGSTPPSTVTASDATPFDTINQDLINAGVNVMNNSWGGITWPSSDTATTQAFDTAYRPFVDSWGGLVVFAAGNDSNPDPSTIAALPSLAPDLARGWLTVVAVDSNHPTQLASYSNRCGIAMDYCLAAPGNVIVLDKATTASTTNPTYYVVEGTSFAAPQVSGAAAVVWQAFPYFSNDLVRQTLLGTADPLGGSQPNPTFGWGELDVGKAIQGPANFAWGDVSVSFDTSRSTWGNDITGAGGLDKSGSGILVLAGNNSYRGDTNVLGGTLQSAHPIPGNANVSSGARLTGLYPADSLAVGLPGVDGNLGNSGNVLVAAGNTSVGGNYTQTASGTLDIALGSILKVGGSASLAGTLNIAGADAGYVTTSHQDLLTAGGGVSGTFSSFTTASGVFLSSTPQYDANDVWIDTTSLSITGTMTVAGYSASPLVMGSARRVDGTFARINQRMASGADVPAAFVAGAGAIQHTPTLARAALSLQSLSGQLHAASAVMALQDIDATSATLGQHLDTLGAYGRFGAWTRDLRLSGDLAQRGMDGVGFQLDGWMFGADRRLGNDGYIGYALSQDRGDSRLDRSPDRDRSHASATLAYLGWTRGRWYGRGQVGFGQYRQDISRQLLLGSRWMPVSTWYDGSYRTARGEGGLHVGHGADMLTPYLDVDYARLDRSGFAEQGAYGFGLQSPAQTLARLQAGAGLRATHRQDLGVGRWLDVNAHVDWQHTLATRGDVFDASFVGVSDWRPLVGVGLSPTIRRFGVGMDAQLGRASTLNLGYDYATGRHVRTTQVMLRYSVAF